MSHKILMVEDDFALAMGTEYALTSEGYEVVSANTLADARQLYDDSIDLVLLDVMLPDGNGLTLCKELREAGSLVPIIFLTAVSEEVNIVQGLETGADDYVTKPYRVKELLARIAVNIRRSGYTDIKKNVDCITFGTSSFYLDSFKLVQNGAVLDCTTSELRLLRELLMNRGNVMSRSTLMEKLYDVDGEFFEDNTLSVYIKRLRDKLGADGDYIETVRGIGYRFKG